LARKFLYLIAIIIGAVIVGGIAWRLNPAPFMRAAFVPNAEFTEPAPAATGYANPAMWLARPGMTGTNPTLWSPLLDGESETVRVQRAAIVAEAATAPDAGGMEIMPPRFAEEPQRGNAAIFFLHPTSYLSRDSWNAPLDNEEANWRATLFTKGMASTFAGAGDIWVPRYRQAAMGAFLTRDVVTANRALNAAYTDVTAAFDQFVSEIGPDRPIILAGHSQGALHLARLLRERVAGRPIAQRIVAAYVVGWPLSVDHDLPMMGLPPCETADSVGCILSWSSYAEPADPAMVLEVFDQTIGFDGQSRRGSRILCTNPITGVRDGSATATANLGTVKGTSDLTDGTIYPGLVPAQCDDPANGGRGFLLIGEAPDVGAYVLPGNNYHVYDYPLFWANVRADANRRLGLFDARSRPARGRGR
jgi:hypothetical protein